jgi:hypothetical protein
VPASKKKQQRSQAPVSVYTVPSLLRPSYVVPIEFTFTTGTNTLVLPPSLASAPFRVTSMRATVASFSTTTPYSLRISLGNGLGGYALQTRNFPVFGQQEIILKNNKTVQHSSDFAAPLMQSVMTGGGNFVGIVFVSFLGTF